MQPRRVVVRNLADYLARQLNENVGETVGYRIKGESKTSSATRLEIITEGVLTRMIQQDPELSGVAAIVFDEFHERSIHSDFGLALALEVQAGLRDDLRLIIMSATLEIEPLNKLLSEYSALPVVNLNTQGRMFPVDIRYMQYVSAHELVPKVGSVIKQAVAEHQGDILVFLPGRGSINAVARDIKPLAESADIALHMLCGALGKPFAPSAAFWFWGLLRCHLYPVYDALCALTKRGLGLGSQAKNAQGEKLATLFLIFRNYMAWVDLRRRFLCSVLTEDNRESV